MAIKSNKKRTSILDEAIADAKTVKEVALQNARQTLLEEFQPRVSRVISTKLAEELEDEDEMGETEDEMDLGTEDETEVESTDEMDTEGGDEVSDESGDEFGEEDLDLESVIRELEGEMEGEEEGGEMEGEEDMDLDLDLEDEDETEDMTESEDMDADDMEGDSDPMEDEEDDIDLDEVIRSLSEDEYVDDGKDGTPANTMKENKILKKRIRSLTNELNKSTKTIKFMKDTISEVNLLNSKLLYATKIFKKYNLTENQKKKVIDHFDRALTTREAKIVYTTISENFSRQESKKSLTETINRRPIASATNSGKKNLVKKEIINENNTTNRMSRMQELAFKKTNV